MPFFNTVTAVCSGFAAAWEGHDPPPGLPGGGFLEFENAGALLARSASEHGSDWLTRNHDQGRCAMYGVCGVRSDGDLLNCATNRIAAEAEPDAADILSSLCPSVWAESGADLQQMKDTRHAWLATLTIEHDSRSTPFTPTTISR